MFSHRRWFLAVTLLALVLPSQAQTADGTISVSRPDGSRLELSGEQLRVLPRTRFEATAHDKTAQFEGSDLRELLRAAGIDTGAPLRGPLLRRVITVRASDGYVVVFALAEIDASIGARKVFLVDRQDGAALDPRDGPWRLVVPADARPARWARQVSAISVIDLPAADALRPASP